MKKAELTPEQRKINKQKNAPLVARIEALQKERGLRTDAMCKGAGVTPSALSQWRTGLTVASVEKVQQFADYFHVSFVWLFTGVQETEKTATQEGDGLNESRRSLIQLFDSLDPAGQAALLADAKALAEARKSQDAQ